MLAAGSSRKLLELVPRMPAAVDRPAGNALWVRPEHRKVGHREERDDETLVVAGAAQIDSGEPQAGYELLRLLREQDPKTPYFIYAGRNAPTQEESQEHGAQGSTNDPAELIRMVWRMVGLDEQ